MTSDKPSILGAMVAAATSWGAVFAVVAVAPALAVWPLAHHHELDYVLDNNIDGAYRTELLTWIVVSVVIVAGLYGLVHAWLRRRGEARDLETTVRLLNRYAFVVASFPLLVVVMNHGIEREHDLFVLTLLAPITALWGVFIYRVHELVRRERPAPARPTWKHAAAIGGAFAIYALYIGYLALVDHRNADTHIYDLGIYDNIFWNTTFGEFLGCSYIKMGNHISAHFDPIIWVLAPIYRLHPDAETLLMLQTVWVGTSVFPLFLIAQHQLQNPRLATLYCFAAILYPAMHGANLFDFHTLTLAVPTTLWIIYFIDTKATIRLFVALAVLLITREDMSLLACFLGAYAMLRGSHLVGLAIVFVSLAYLTLIKLYVMPDPGLLMTGEDAYGYEYFYREMIPEGTGVRGFVSTLVTNPGYTLKVFFKEGRIVFLLTLLQPVLFLPLAAAKKRFILIYGLVFCGLATREHVFDIHFQYSSVFFPALLAAAPAGVVAVAESRAMPLFGLDRKRMISTLVWTILVSSVLVSAKFGAMIPNANFKTGWNPMRRKLDVDRYEFLQSLIAQIPEDAVVCATSSLGPHVSARAGAHKWPACDDSEYALLLSGHFRKAEKARLRAKVQRKALELIDGDHGIELYRFTAKATGVDSQEMVDLAARREPDDLEAPSADADADGEPAADGLEP
jgi:uncharacterized membrane protein